MNNKFLNFWQKTFAIIKLKAKMLIGNTAALTGPLMSVAITVFMKFLYSDMVEGDNSPILTYVLNFGISFNLGLGAIMMSALPLAEDKEKHTLRSLMTSSVNGLQFFIGSIFWPFLVSVVVNYIVIFVSGVNTATIDMAMFSFLTIISSLISCMLGLLIGIIAKSQVNANNLMMPFIMVLSLVPTLSTLNDTLGKISNFLYTGIITNMLNNYSEGLEFNLSFIQIAILLVCIVGISAMFVNRYKKVLVCEA
ncbi:MAG: ABC transporter permease [Christensenellaceae bacterium]|nr:ABC transporter permease [Christensenellaceae bacterium]